MSSFHIGDQVIVTVLGSSDISSRDSQHIGIVVKSKRQIADISCYVVKYRVTGSSSTSEYPNAGHFPPWLLKFESRVPIEQLLTSSDEQIRAVGIKLSKRSVYDKTPRACG